MPRIPEPLALMIKLTADCPKCSGTLVLNGPSVVKRCGYCQSDVSVPAAFWQKLLRVDLLPRGAVMPHFEGLSNVDVDADLGVACPSCGDRVVLAQDGGRCGKCGRADPMQPLPEFLRGVRSGSGALRRLVPIGLLFASSGEQAAAKAGTSHVIAFNCASCAAGLRLTADMPRTIVCEYCDTSQYLPDGLWRAVHPVEVKRPWYICFAESSKADT